jgi:hypothetical protein
MMQFPLTPVEQPHDLMLLKREDLYAGASGVNGAKYRACQHLVRRARARGATRVVSAASVLSPQNAIAATVAAEEGLPCSIVVGGTTPEKAIRHRPIKMAVDLGADVHGVAVGYNPFIQRAGAERAALWPGAWQLPYGITTPKDATERDVEDFLEVGAEQVANIPDKVETIFIPFGSGNTAAGVLSGLVRNPPRALRRIVLMGIGPDRWDWVHDRVDLSMLSPIMEHHALHPHFATYGDKMPETLYGVRLHPTYEGKIARWFKENPDPDWGSKRSLFWIVGGPL